MTNEARYQAGWDKLTAIDPEAGEIIINNFKDIAPELGNFIIEHAYGDIYTRSGLDLKSKEIAVVAALTALGTAQPQLKNHIKGALNTGSSINEIKEVIFQMAVFSGFPSCINAINALIEILSERKDKGIKDNAGKDATTTLNDDRLLKGEKELTVLDNLQVEKLYATYNEIAPDLVKFILEFGYADIFSRDNLDKKYRQIATIAALTALGNAQPQLKFHINAGLNIGLTVENIKEIMILMTIYAGFPAAINGTNILKDVVASRTE